MTVRTGVGVDARKFPRSHEGMTPFSIINTILAADTAGLNQVLLARLPDNRVAIQNIIGALVVRHDVLDTNATETLVYDIGISGLDGVLTTTLFAGIIMGDVAATVSMAQNAAAADWFLSTLPEQYLTFDVTTISATPAEGNLTVGGIYSAGLNIIGPEAG